MKVKIGDKIYSDCDEPIMIILTESDKFNIANMSPNNYKYCSYPENVNHEMIKKFMKIKEV